MTETATKNEVTQTDFQKKKTIFRSYQIIWYILSVIEVLLAFRFILKALGANSFNGFVAFVYGVSDPLALPFYGIFRTSTSSLYTIEWSTLIGMVVYALIAYGLVDLFQFIKPVSKKELEQKL